MSPIRAHRIASLMVLLATGTLAVCPPAQAETCEGHVTVANMATEATYRCEGDTCQHIVVRYEHTYTALGCEASDDAFRASSR